jgi:hypothetical protein
MGTIFSKYKDTFIDLVTERVTSNLKFPLQKTGDKFNGYTRGDFIIVGGRKTSGKSSFILNNYVTSPIYQKSYAKSKGKPFDIRILYINTRKNLKSTIERMIVNYTSYASGGSKIGVPALYGYRGNEYPLTASKAKKLVSKAMNVFDVFVEKGFLTVSTGRKSLFEIEQLINETFSELGEFDDDGSFIYHEEFDNTIPIVAIDGAGGIYGDAGGSALRNESATLLAIKLKEMAKIYEAVIILGVPSYMSYRNKNTTHISSADEIEPYATYCDRSIIIHNPLETNEAISLGYEVPSFVNNASGICYLRTAQITSNYMGASGVSFGYFVFPENGFLIELPPAEDEDDLGSFIGKVATKVKDKEATVKVIKEAADIEEEMANNDLNLSIIAPIKEQDKDK